MKFTNHLRVGRRRSFEAPLQACRSLQEPSYIYHITVFEHSSQSWNRSGRTGPYQKSSRAGQGIFFPSSLWRNCRLHSTVIFKKNGCYLHFWVERSIFQKIEVRIKKHSEKRYTKKSAVFHRLRTQFQPGGPDRLVISLLIQPCLKNTFDEHMKQASSRSSAPLRGATHG